MVEKELNTLLDLRKKINHCLATKQYGYTRKLIKVLERSPFALEVENIKVPAVSKILIAENKLEEAKQNLLAGICYCWDNDEAFKLLRSFNQKTDHNSKVHYIEVKGGCARFGLFTKYSADHIGSFEVVANDLFEAMSYIEEICNFEFPAEKKLAYWAINKKMPKNCTERGVYVAYPFRLDPHDRLWAA